MPCFLYLNNLNSGILKKFVECSRRNKILSETGLNLLIIIVKHLLIKIFDYKRNIKIINIK